MIQEVDFIQASLLAWLIKEVVHHRQRRSKWYPSIF